MRIIILNKIPDNCFILPYYFLSIFYNICLCTRIFLTMQLYKNITQPHFPYLVFTSAGDHSNIDQWLRGERHFDLWITYYGDQQERLKDKADFYNQRKDGKFPNLYYLYQMFPDILEKYQAIMVMDDDIIIDTESINQLFRIRERYDLWLLQPSFDPRGKNSHWITITNPRCLLRYTNFVELGCPLFRKICISQ